MRKRVRVTAPKPAQTDRPNSPMQYGASRITGKFVGGCFWNPPSNCIGRIMPYFDEKWVNVCVCRYHCAEYKKCEASKVSTKLRREEYDIPQNRQKSRVRVRRG